MATRWSFWTRPTTSTRFGSLASTAGAETALEHSGKDALADHVFSDPVVVDWDKSDRYERIVGKVIHGDQDVNLA